MFIRTSTRTRLRDYSISGMLLLMLVALIAARVLPSIAAAVSSHVTMEASTDDDNSPSVLHTHSGGFDTDGDQLFDGLPEWLPSPEGQTAPRLASVLEEGDGKLFGRDVEPLPLPPRA